MKALLLTALLVPMLALADGDTRKTQNAQKTKTTDLTSTEVLGTLRKIHQASIALGNLAKANSQASSVKSLGGTMVKDHEKLDAKVTEYALKNNIVLSSNDTKTTYDKDPGDRSDRSLNQSGTDQFGHGPGTVSERDREVPSTGAIGAERNKTTPMGTDTTMDRDRGPQSERYTERSGGSEPISNELGGSTDRMSPNAPALAGSEAYPETPAGKEMDKLNTLRGLNGTAFDREFLSRVVDQGNVWIGKLKDQKGKFDKTVDGEITRTIDVLKKNVSEAQRLQATLRVS